MALRLQQVPIVRRLRYLENGEELLRLPKVSLYRRYVLRFRITIRTGGTPFDADAATIRPFGLWNLIKHVRLEIGQGTNKFHYGGVDKVLVDLFERGVVPQGDPLTDIPANSEKTFNLYMIVDFSTSRHRLSDFTALLNAVANQQNDLFCFWGSIDDLYTTSAPSGVEIVADKTNIEVDTLRAFDDGRDPIEINDVAANLLDYREGVEEFDIEKENTSFDDSIQRIPMLPAGVVIGMQLFQTWENSRSKLRRLSDSVINQFKIVNALGASETLVQADWGPFQAANRADFKLHADQDNTGVIYLDYPDQRQGTGILNLRADDLETRITTARPAANTVNGLRIFTRYMELRQQ